MTWDILAGIIANLVSTPLIAFILYIWKKFKELVTKDYREQNAILRRSLKEKDDQLNALGRKSNS